MDSFENDVIKLLILLLEEGESFHTQPSINRLSGNMFLLNLFLFQRGLIKFLCCFLGCKSRKIPKLSPFFFGGAALSRGDKNHTPDNRIMIL